MNATEFALRVSDNLPYEPNGQQIGLIAALARFCSPQTQENSVFLLNGYAGTGKTSVTAALVKTLRDVGIKPVLLAPTGRAAKVFGRFAGLPAFTIHRKIYRRPTASDPYGSLAANCHSDTIFVVDEASMIGNDTDAGKHSLLDDLIEYVYSGDNCKLILLGDTAQLPPVGSALSPAMDVASLKRFGLKVTRVTMTQTVRQGADSGILFNATRLRRAMKLESLPVPSIRATGFQDVGIVESTDLQDYLETSYCADNGLDDTLLITRSNKRAVAFNMEIRARVLEKEEELNVGERLLIARNNYLWTTNISGISFIANGDVVEIVRIYGTENLGFNRFADVRLRFPDKEDVELDAKISLDSLTSEAPSLTQDKLNEIISRRATQSGAQTKSAFATMIRTDPYINALQVKYAYAVTCHKAQGGQWRRVFIDMGYIPEEAYTSLDLYRWLYTAITRATEHVFLINPGINIV